MTRFTDVQTYIASGNVIFGSALASAKVKSALEAKLHAFAGKPIGVVVRTAAELRAVLDANPFADAKPNYTIAIFLDGPLPRDTLEHATGRTNEEMRLGEREVFVHYPAGMGRSKLKIPAARNGTARNINTIAELVEISSVP